MKKIPTLFKRVFEGKKKVGILDEITPGCEDAFKYGVPTVKYDGACCAIINGVFYKRYDAKNGKTPPEGAIPCCDPDPVTGHWPHWVRVNAANPADKWFVEAYINTIKFTVCDDGTYEAVGPHFQGNPYDLDVDRLTLHGRFETDDFERTFEGVREYLKEHETEGIVFWYNGEPVCKIKRSDFGLEWPVKY